MTCRLSRRRASMLAALPVMLPLAAAAASPDLSPADSPTHFVDAALHDTVVAMAQPAPARGEQLRAVFQRYVDVPQLGRNCVGPAWLLVGPDQQAAFLATFETFLITGYGGSMGQPGAITFAPSEIAPPPAQAAAVDPSRRILVRVEARGSDGPPHPLLLTLDRHDDDSYRIVDISAQSISLGRTLAADFSGFLSHNGGKLDSLMGALKQKIAARVAER
jgi:phospholipid transport system substrate-binding protein